MKTYIQELEERVQELRERCAELKKSCDEKRNKFLELHKDRKIYEPERYNVHFDKIITSKFRKSS